MIEQVRDFLAVLLVMIGTPLYATLAWLGWMEPTFEKCVACGVVVIVVVVVGVAFLWRLLA